MILDQSNFKNFQASHSKEAENLSLLALSHAFIPLSKDAYGAQQMFCCWELNNESSISAWFDWYKAAFTLPPYIKGIKASRKAIHNFVDVLSDCCDSPPRFDYCIKQIVFGGKEITSK